MIRRFVWGRQSPSTVVLVLAAANVVAFELSARGGFAPTVQDLVSAGALTKWTLQSGQYWRLLACGFLHANVLHLATNLVSLFVCGPALEQRLGPTAFALVYFVALAFGSLTSVAAHGAVFVGVGASGAILGLMGGLFALWILGKINLHPRFFLINFGLMGVANASSAHVDVAAHLGGFAAGMVSVALLDLAGRATGGLLRCKFPEFVKANALVLVSVAGAVAWMLSEQAVGVRLGLASFAAWGCGSLALVVLLDLLLAVRRGLAGIVVVLGLCNGLAACAGAFLLMPVADAACRMALYRDGAFDAVTRVFCPAVGCAPGIAFAVALVFSALVYAGAFRRGLSDVGFVSAMLMADRRRERG